MPEKTYSDIFTDLNEAIENTNTILGNIEKYTKSLPEINEKAGIIDVECTALINKRKGEIEILHQTNDKFEKEFSELVIVRNKLLELRQGIQDIPDCIEKIQSLAKSDNRTIEGIYRQLKEKNVSTEKKRMKCLIC